MTVSEVMSEAAVLSEGRGKKKNRTGLRGVAFKDTDTGAKYAEASDLKSYFRGSGNT